MQSPLSQLFYLSRKKQMYDQIMESALVLLLLVCMFIVQLQLLEVDIYIYMIKQVPSYVLMGIPHGTASPAEPLLLTPMGEACLRMDLTAIHEILEKAGYKDDEGIANEVNF